MTTLNVEMSEAAVRAATAAAAREQLNLSEWFEHCALRAAAEQSSKPANPWEGVPRDKNGWPVGYFEQTFGVIDDPTFVVPDDEPEKPGEPLTL